jgi:hypothetical protein
MVVEDPVDDAHRGAVHQIVGALEIGPQARADAGKDDVVERGDPIAGVGGSVHVVEQLPVLLDRRKAVLERHAQLVGALAERVGVLRHVPDVGAEEQLYLHLGRRRHPARQRLHQRDHHVPVRRNGGASFLDAQTHRSSTVFTVFSIRSAVSSGRPTSRW